MVNCELYFRKKLFLYKVVDFLFQFFYFQQQPCMENFNSRFISVLFSYHFVLDTFNCFGQFRCRNFKTWKYVHLWTTLGIFFRFFFHWVSFKVIDIIFNIYPNFNAYFGWVFPVFLSIFTSNNFNRYSWILLNTSWQLTTSLRSMVV